MLAFLEANRDPASPLAARRASPTRRGPGCAGGSRLCLGWLRADVDGRRVLWHSGGTGGFRTVCGLVEGESLSVVVLTSSARSAERLGIELVRALAP